MLKIIHSIDKIDFRLLADVYAQSCQENGRQTYPDRSIGEQLLCAEQDLYGEVKCFFQDKNAFYAVWEHSGRYVAVLRMEPYRDGLLLEGLETVPEERRKGYAKELVNSVVSVLDEPIVYSHIDKTNSASLAVHSACGFEKMLDYAVYADGSVSHGAYTMRYQKY